MATGACAHENHCDASGAPAVDDTCTQVLGSPRIGAGFRVKLLSLIGRWLPVVSRDGGGVM